MADKKPTDTKPADIKPPELEAKPLDTAPVQANQPTPGLTQSVGLRELPDSQVPGLAGGGMISHVFGPGQSPVDPVAAGLDLGYNPLSKAENRMVTNTGTMASGNQPSTYLGKGPVPEQNPADHATNPAPSDDVAAASPGPNSTGGDAPPITEKT